MKQWKGVLSRILFRDSSPTPSVAVRPINETLIGVYEQDYRIEKDTPIWMIVKALKLSRDLTSEPVGTKTIKQMTLNTIVYSCGKKTVGDGCYSTGSVKESLTVDERVEYLTWLNICRKRKIGILDKNCDSKVRSILRLLKEEGLVHNIYPKEGFRRWKITREGKNLLKVMEALGNE